MSGTLNKVMLIGHLGDVVKMRYFDDKNCVGRFSLATSETYTNKQTNEKVTNTEWHNIVLRNKAAEICEKYLKKGDKVYIEGRLKTRKWQDDKGNDRNSTEIQCIDFTFLTPKNEKAEDNSEIKNKITTGNKNAAPQDQPNDLPFFN
jgi:single-strand DNA-binding protein